jgi:hypothetical protein
MLFVEICIYFPGRILKKKIAHYINGNTAQEVKRVVPILTCLYHIPTQTRTGKSVQVKNRDTIIFNRKVLYAPEVTVLRAKKQYFTQD